ncbi:hypothetical protein LZC95_27985 [Pendulispora brunnea]|uniref:Uncharacterized protein n=1 Tax=Pendulispora brunnea TaxID=2905690 RepID=A0ABZ2JZV9_9BACT
MYPAGEVLKLEITLPHFGKAPVGLRDLCRGAADGEHLEVACISPRGEIDTMVATREAAAIVESLNGAAPVRFPIPPGAVVRFGTTSLEDHDLAPMRDAWARAHASRCRGDEPSRSVDMRLGVSRVASHTWRLRAAIPGVSQSFEWETAENVCAVRPYPAPSGYTMDCGMDDGPWPARFVVVADWFYVALPRASAGPGKEEMYAMELPCGVHVRFPKTNPCRRNVAAGCCDHDEDRFRCLGNGP